MTEIFIENKRLDISEGLSNLLTFQLDDIRDFASRNCTFSKTITLPGTKNNNSVLGNIFNTSISNPYDPNLMNVNSNFNPSVAASCIIFNDRIQVFKGTLRILEIIVNSHYVEYEVSVFGELGGLVNAIGANKLTDLDFSAYDELWNAANAVASWNSIDGTGLYYPLIDYGTVSTLKVNYDMKAFRPALYVREYLDKIITNAGYRFSSNLFDTARFKSLIIPNNEKNLATLQPYDMKAGPSSFSYTNVDGASKLIPLPIQTILQNFTPNGANTIFTYTGDPFTHFFYFNFVGYFTKNSTTPFVVDILKNGVVDSSHTFESSAPSVATYFELKDTGTVALASGDTFSLRISQAVATVWDISFSTGSSNFILETPQRIPVTAAYGDFLSINDSTIPKNILQKDFLSSIIRLFNLYVYENTLDNKKLYIEPYVDFYNTTGVTDYTYKADRSQEIRLKPMSELNSRYYNFRFKPDTDYYNDLYKKTYNETYGDYVFDSAFAFGNESEDIELIFAPTPLVGYLGVDKMVSAIYKKNAGVEERTSSIIRILQAKKITGVTSWDILNDATTLISGLTSYGYAGHYDDPDVPANDIQFGVPRELYFTLVSGAINVTQFNVYWSSYMAEITDKDSQLLTGFFKLTNADIHNLDFSKPVYFDGSLWRLNKIEDWNANNPDLCKVSLLKIIKMVY